MRTVRGNLIGHIALIDEELTGSLAELKIDTKEDVIVCAMSSPQPPRSPRVAVPFVQRLWKLNPTHD